MVMTEKFHVDLRKNWTVYSYQGSHFFGLTKFHDISMIFPGFFSKFPGIFFIIFNKFPGIFSLFLNYDFQVVLNINMQT